MKNENAVATLIAGVEAERPDWLKAGNAGSEEVRAMDMIIPRLDVLQALSPQIKKSDPSYIPGAEQGMIYNTVTGELYGAEVNFVPVFFRKEWLLWKTRKAGGGFFGAYRTEAEANIALCAAQDPGSHEVVETHQHFVLVLLPSGVQQAVMSMSKSKLKVSRSLNTLVQMSEADRFAKAYKASTVEASSQKGEFWNLRITAIGFVTKQLYDKGKELYEAIKSGAADVDRTSPDSGEGHVESAEL